MVGSTTDAQLKAEYESEKLKRKEAFGYPSLLRADTGPANSNQAAQTGKCLSRLRLFFSLSELLACGSHRLLDCGIAAIWQQVEKSFYNFGVARSNVQGSVNMNA